MESSAYDEFRDLEAHHWWFRGRRIIFESLLGRYVDRFRKDEQTALDLGCGMGGMLGIVSSYGREIGADISKDALGWCIGRGFPRVLLATGDHLPFPDASLDFITAFDTIEHIPDEASVARECFRVLKPGGLLFVSVPAYQFLFSHQDRIVHHQRRYTLTSLASMFRRAGFQVERASYINFLLFPLILPVLLLIKLKEAIFPPRDTMATNVSFPIPAACHRFLAQVFGFERHLVRGCTVPFGHSLVAVGRKPKDPT